MNTKNRTKFILFVGLFIWMASLFFFLNRSRFEQSLVFAKVLPTGLVIRPIKIIDDTSKIDPNVNPDDYVIDTVNIDTSKNIKTAYSLRAYAPPVMSQGNLGSCVSWACAYAGLTIVKRIEQNNPNAEKYSPLNLYVRYKKQYNEGTCSDGASIPHALNILKSQGCSLFSNFIPNACSTSVSKDAVYNEKLFTFDPINPSAINTIKNAISLNMPVVIGIRCYDGTDWQNAFLINGVWSGYYSGKVDGGHAMCITGYDDNKFGGAFEVMNSWGDDWGDKGYFWIKYKDFLKHVTQSYALMPSNKKTN